jgi:hypothetical protein
MKIEFKGPLITDTSIPGERKADGITPEISCCVQASRDKWLILFGTLDSRGHDTNRSIFYQLRQGTPDGTVMKEGIIEKARSGWDPLGVGHSFRKVNGLVKAFGVPKGALHNGQPIPTANHFVAKWYTRPSMEINGLLVSPHREGWPSEINVEDLGIHAGCLEWVQFRLNDTEDDIEISSSASQLRQEGYDQGNVISSLGACLTMHHGFGDPVPDSESFTEWVEVCQFEKKVAAVRYSFNPTRGRYEWVETGKAQQIPGRHLAEASLNKIDNDWVISVRAYDAEGQTTWYRTADPFESFGDGTDVRCTYVPRISFLCADGVLRLFSNDGHLSPYGDMRNPLYAFDVHPTTFEYSNTRVILDCRKANLTFHQPMIDHAMIYPHAGGRRQLVSFRAITLKQTKQDAEDPDTTPEELEKSGVYCSELVYDKDYPNAWNF